MKEKVSITPSPDSVRELSKKILEESADLLKIDLNSVNQVLVPRLQRFMLDSHPSTTREGNDLSLQESLGVTLFYNVINFCYKDPENGHEYEFRKDGKVIKRSTGLFIAMMSADINWGDFLNVANLTPEKWAELTQIDENNTMFLGMDRGRRIKLFANKLVKDGFYSPGDFLEAMNFDTDNILPYLADSGFFTDDFLKRAQLNIRMLDDVFKQYKVAGIKNTNKLTAMADYRIPQVFYNLGAVIISPKLEMLLEGQYPIEPGSREEKALRATVPVIAEHVAKALNIEEGYADTLLWTLSQVMAKNNELPVPHMIVATDAY